MKRKKKRKILEKKEIEEANEFLKSHNIDRENFLHYMHHVMQQKLWSQKEQFCFICKSKNYKKDEENTVQCSYIDPETKIQCPKCFHPKCKVINDPTEPNLTCGRHLCLQCLKEGKKTRTIWGCDACSVGYCKICVNRKKLKATSTFCENCLKIKEAVYKRE